MNPLRLLVVLAVGVLAACQQSPATDGADATRHGALPSASNEPVIAPVPAPASTAGAALAGDHASTPRYRIAIELPTLPTSERLLAASLRAAADHLEREFLASLPDPAQLPEFAHRQFELSLTYKVAATTPAFTSVRESGSEDTGGAHPIPLQATFVFDRKSGRLITLDDLFADPAGARVALAKVARETLLKRFLASAPTSNDGSPAALREWRTNMLQMLDGGTRPTSVNYSLFVVRAGATANDASPGLTLVFAPYQVAPYVYGTQIVDVPTMDFARFLKPQYASAFAH